MPNEKHIFIGIGGSGCVTVSQIKEKVYEKRFSEATASKTRLQAMNDSYRFLFIDTDQRDIDMANKRNRESFEQGKVPFISPQTDLINLGRANPAAIYYEAKKNPNNLLNKRILEACSKELAAKIPDQPLSFGAGAFRMKSRIAFAHSLTDFQSKLQAAISSLNDVKTVGGEDCIIYYWVVGSTLGGTGSGIFNDVLYHVNQIHHQVVGNGDPQLVLTMYMPKVYIDSNSTEEKYTLNAYGVFSELKAFKKMSYEGNQNTVMHRLSFQNDYSLIDNKRRYCPFYYLIPIDIQTDKGTSLGTPPTMYRNTAEMLYHLHNGLAGATFRSDIDNYMNDIMERNHEDFLVPMGYVSLQKPREQFAKYMRTRFKRDLLRSWLLVEDKAKVDKSDVDELYDMFFKHLNAELPGSIANSIKSRASAELETLITNGADSSKQEISGDLQWDNLYSVFNQAAEIFQSESEDDKRKKYKKILVDCLWEQAEVLIRKHGLAYTSNAIVKVRDEMAKRYKEKEKKHSDLKNEITQFQQELPDLGENARVVTRGETILKNNDKDIRKYVDKLQEYLPKFIEYEMNKWQMGLERDFCQDEKNDELSILKKHVDNMQDKANEMNRAAVASYKKLANEFGDAAMDVTTVYLPMLKTVCDGNGWIQDNFFSKMYTKIIDAQGKEEIPNYENLKKNFVDKYIYISPDEKTKAEINKGEYKVSLKMNPLSDNDDEEASKTIDDTRFFANPDLAEKGVSNERIIEGFLSIATSILEKKMHEDKTIQEKWDNRKISEFFGDLTNDEKDEVRRSLNPALFFSYNSNRIEVMKKEEHLVFVAGSEDLAMEMLGYQKGNTKHRHVKSDDENTALVLKSKFGLSLDDYRIYNSIKTVYDNATFREKYHFHHDFAQFLDKITLDDLPYEVLPQHRSFVKMLLLDSYKDEMDSLFYRDIYDEESYTNSMYWTDPDCKTYFKIAQPEALTMNTQPGQAPIILRKEENGRPLFIEIEGADFIQQFDKYSDLYHNYGFGDTVERLIQEVLRQKLMLNGQNINGEEIFKKSYEEKRDTLLRDLSNKKKASTQFAEQRIYNTFFIILRDELDTVHKFIRNVNNN